MQAALAPRGDARTFLAHFGGGGLDDDRYVIQRYLSRANGDIVPVNADGTKPKGRRRPRPTIASLQEVENIRPARGEIIIATGIKLRNCGVQLWGMVVLPSGLERWLDSYDRDRGKFPAFAERCDAAVSEARVLFENGRWQRQDRRSVQPSVRLATCWTE